MQIPEVPAGVVGIGIDVVDIARFSTRLERVPRLRERLFCGAELGLNPTSLAGRFAAKEAIAKALGAPGNLRWIDAEVIPDEHGKPEFTLRNTVLERANALGISHVHLSISHDGGIAMAIVIAERKPA